MKQRYFSLVFSLIVFTVCWAVLPVLAAEREETTTINKLAEQSVYQIRVINKKTGEKISIGSGFIVRHANILATNYHVISRYVNESDRFTLQYLAHNGSTGPLELIGIDIIHDLGLLKAKKSLGIPLKLAGIPKKGARLFSLGNPLDLGFSISEGTNNGIISNSEEKNILVSGSLNPGMSGGPTLNVEGKVVGVNVATSGNEISFVVPVHHLTKLLNQVEQNNYKILDNYDENISRQLIVNARKNLNDLLLEDWDQKVIGRFKVPARLKKSFRCWDASPNSRKENVLFERTSASCSNEYHIYLSSSLDVGSISYEYHWISTKELKPVRFYKAYEGINYSVPPGDASKDSVTNFACYTDFINVSKQDFKATICRRDYYNYPGLSDVMVTMALVGHKQEGLIFNLDIVGTDFEYATKLLVKILMRFQWIG